jgi:hypothetical protein
MGSGKPSIIMDHLVLLPIFVLRVGNIRSMDTMERERNITENGLAEGEPILSAGETQLLVAKIVIDKAKTRRPKTKRVFNVSPTIVGIGLNFRP